MTFALAVFVSCFFSKSRENHCRHLPLLSAAKEPTQEDTPLLLIDSPLRY